MEQVVLRFALDTHTMTVTVPLDSLLGDSDGAEDRVVGFETRADDDRRPGAPATVALADGRVAPAPPSRGHL